MVKETIIAQPHGFCQGVKNALSIAQKALTQAQSEGKVLYCLNEIVHNRLIVDDLKSHGMVFVHDISQVPNHERILFSAHGVSPSIRKQAQEKSLEIIDATCIFVTKLHEAVRHYAKQGTHTLLIGSPNHDEVLGVRGEAPESVTIIENEAEAHTITPPTTNLAILTQTTLAAYQVEPIIKILKDRFPGLIIPDKSGICYATTSRQEAVRNLAKTCDIILVLGSPSSANSNRLVDVARTSGKEAYLIPDIPALNNFIQAHNLTNQKIGLTAGASTPEYIVEKALEILQK